ncbi:MAG: response regulator transcription factor [Chloroflexota bacterium]|nr:response regulator transcription factor [Chloroflexota bacterium]
MNKEILLVDDDPLLRRSLALSLEEAGYTTRMAGSAEEGLELAREKQPDLVLLDIGLPGMDGLAAVQHFQEDIGVPVIFLTARRRELDEVLGLELGADDYVTKPFDPDVLLARVRATLRRTRRGGRAASTSALEVGDLTIDRMGRTVKVGGRAVELPPRAFDLLYALASRADQAVSMDELLTQVWGRGYEGESQVVYVHIRWLRKELEEDPDHPRRIVTVRGVGYRLVPQEP